MKASYGKCLFLMDRPLERSESMTHLYIFRHTGLDGRYSAFTLENLSAENGRKFSLSIFHYNINRK